ncbi:MAG: hypothetical protein KHZ87_07940, partial [Clostridiales bacterium]|nr:hypothetical protein [Clostridiales bacterium]MBS5878480.1 hypothetical protein [Clostridiales bacterium]
LMNRTVLHGKAAIILPLHKNIFKNCVHILDYVALHGLFLLAFYETVILYFSSIYILCSQYSFMI